MRVRKFWLEVQANEAIRIARSLYPDDGFRATEREAVKKGLIDAVEMLREEALTDAARALIRAESLDRSLILLRKTERRH